MVAKDGMMFEVDIFIFNFCLFLRLSGRPSLFKVAAQIILWLKMSCF